MRSRGALGAALPVVLLALGGCVYYNAIYNAERAFAEAEEARGLGRDSLAMARYDEVVRKAAAGFRKDPTGSWADEALYLLGRARARRGELAEAEAALREARARTDDPQVALGARVWLGAVAILRGQDQAGLDEVNAAMAGLQEGAALAEGHLWRARVLLRGQREELLGSAWWDLDRAAALADGARVPAALERVRWGIHHRDAARVREGTARLLAHPRGGARRDSLEALMDEAAAVWDPEDAAAFLEPAPGAAWDRTERGRIGLARARLLRRAGRTADAWEEARRVASGIGPSAAEARLLLAGWALSEAADLVEARAVVPLLLPSEDDERVAALLDGLGRLGELADRGLEEPLALFAAAELARDELGAPELARGLFLAYAGGAPAEPWASKALLAALASPRADEDQSWIRARLEERRSSPYVLAALGRPAPGLEALEEELARRLEELVSR